MSRYAQTLRTCSLVFTAIILMTVPAVAQVTTGSISGRVLDGQDRGVAGASVTATSSGTGTSRSATTGEAGDYTITTLPAGKYDLTVEAPNFKKTLAEGFELNVGANAAQNFRLEPGEVTATVSGDR